MRLYLAGPMRGLPRYNFDAFAVAAAALRAHGHTVYSPAENDAAEGWSPFAGEDPEPDVLARMFLWDLRRIVGIGRMPVGYHRYERVADEKELEPADAVALLPGWRRSGGARLEALVAQSCGVGLYTVDPKAEGWLKPLPPQVLSVQFETLDTDPEFDGDADWCMFSGLRRHPLGVKQTDVEVVP